jgi:hypothetical protein
MDSDELREAVTALRWIAIALVAIASVLVVMALRH